MQLFSPTDNAPEPLLVARELVKRWFAEDLTKRPVFCSPASVREFLCLHFHHLEYETFTVLHLNAQHHLIEVEDIFRGTLTQTAVYPREIVKSALRHNAAAVIFCHNHPSGVCEPSQADRILTQLLKSALALVDVQVLDHFVVAGTTAFSFSEHGLL